MAAVVSDTSPLRALGHLSLLDLLRVLYGQILLPPAVEQELQYPPPGLPVVQVAQLPFVRIQAPQNRGQVLQFLQSLDAGESEALALALEVQAVVLLIDEKAGRMKAKQLGVRSIGTLGVLLEAKQNGLIPAVRPLMDRLQNEIRFFIAPRLRAQVLQLAGE